MLNKKRPIASTKDRSKVSGGGRKPWAQKGTGRARAGSSRSPLWKGGGVTFGPSSERNYKGSVPKKMNVLALTMGLEKKKEDKEILIVDAPTLEEPKTKFFNSWLKRIVEEGSALVVLDKNMDAMKRAGKNIPHIKVTDFSNIDIIDILRYKYIVATKEAWKKLEKRTYNNISK